MSICLTVEKAVINMSIFTDATFNLIENNQRKTIELLEKISEKFEFLCGLDYNQAKKQQKRKTVIVEQKKRIIFFAT